MTMNTPTSPFGRYLGSWILPSGNSVDVYLLHPRPGDPMTHIQCRWNRPPSPAWPPEDLRHYWSVVIPEIASAMTRATSEGVIGIAG